MYPFYNNATQGFPLFPLIPFAHRRTKLRTIDNQGIYEVYTTGILETTTAGQEEVTYGLSPSIWRALPNESIILWKVRHTASTAAAEYPVTVAIPTGSSSSTVSSNSSPSNNAGTSKVPVVDNKGTQTTGSQVANTGEVTEHLVYVNKCTDTFRLLGVTTPAAAAPAA